jgi:hypothetical protein
LCHPVNDCFSFSLGFSCSDSNDLEYHHRGGYGTLQSVRASSKEEEKEEEENKAMMGPVMAAQRSKKKEEET